MDFNLLQNRVEVIEPGKIDAQKVVDVGLKERGKDLNKVKTQILFYLVYGIGFLKLHCLFNMLKFFCVHLLKIHRIEQLCYMSTSSNG